MVEPTLQTLGLGLASAAKIIQALNELVRGDARAQVTALYDVILAAQTSAMEANLKQSAMIDRIRELEEELTRAKAWETQKQRYQLLSPWTDNASVVYALKESAKSTEAPHWICAKCYDDGRRSILNQSKAANGYILIVCPTCKAEIYTGYRGIQSPN